MPNIVEASENMCKNNRHGPRRTENNNDSSAGGGLSIDEVERLIELVHDRETRIEELENALRDSVKIVAERETVLQQEENRRKLIMDKVKMIFS